MHAPVAVLLPTRADSYKWKNATLQSFLSFAAREVGVRQADVWRCDIDHYGRTADWFIEAMATFLAMP